MTRSEVDLDTVRVKHLIKGAASDGTRIGIGGAVTLIANRTREYSAPPRANTRHENQ